MFSSGEMFEPDWYKINKEREILRKTLTKLFKDESNGNYEVRDYFSPPEDGRSNKAKCDFCNYTEHFLDTPELIAHLLDEHIEKVEIN